ncbi:MAG TPA: hypothetical protein VMJ10_18730 [Kofleriaceae bacterium]|nr:hypothetical protein [Kofleriaceae bacterium]
MKAIVEIEPIPTSTSIAGTLSRARSRYARGRDGTVRDARRGRHGYGGAGQLLLGAVAQTALTLSGSGAQRNPV